jgi:hypothetical protein
MCRAEQAYFRSIGQMLTVCKYEVLDLEQTLSKSNSVENSPVGECRVKRT